VVTETEEKRVFKELVDRSLIILATRCTVCGAYLARVKYPSAAKLDSSCDADDHFKATGHISYEALKILIVYMCQADKDLANELSEEQRKAFDKFMETFKQ